MFNHKVVTFCYILKYVTLCNNCFDFAHYSKQGVHKYLVPMFVALDYFSL